MCTQQPTCAATASASASTQVSSKLHMHQCEAAELPPAASQQMELRGSLMQLCGCCVWRLVGNAGLTSQCSVKRIGVFLTLDCRRVQLPALQRLVRRQQQLRQAAPAAGRAAHPPGRLQQLCVRPVRRCALPRRHAGHELSASSSAWCLAAWPVTCGMIAAFSLLP